MSKKKKKQQQQQKDKNLSGFLNSIKLLLNLVCGWITLVLLKLKVKCTSMLKSDCPSKSSGGSSSSSKKEARLSNKQSKMVAEYRLMMTGGEPEAKKIKLDNNGGGGARTLLDPEQFKLMKKELAERKRMLTQLPRFNLTQLGKDASVFCTEYSTRTPLLLPDIQHLITYAYGGNELIPPPSRWCALQKPNRLVQLVVLLVEGLGLNEFVDNEHLLTRSMKIFGDGSSNESSSNRCIAEVLDPQWYGGTLEGEVSRWGLFEVDEGDEDGRGGGVGRSKDILQQLGSVFPIVPKALQGAGAAATPSSSNDDKFCRTSLVLSLPQLIQEGYPLPIPSNPATREANVKFVQTSREYAPVHASSPMFAIDCEMCATVDDPNALAKIAVVDERLELVYETLVRPKRKIVDYRTKWSGITKEMLEGVEVKLKDVQERIKELVRQHPDCILVGQSLNCDLNSLRMIHPYVIDTSVCFNLTGVEGRKSKLKDLAFNLLDEKIQTDTSNNGQSGHSPVEDAITAMKLVKAKLASDITFGNAVRSSNNKTLLSEPVIETLDNYFKEKRNTLDKDVLVIQNDNASKTNSCFTTNSDSDSDDAKTPSLAQTNTDTKLSLPLLYHRTNNKPPSQEKSKIKLKTSPSNRATIKLLISSLFDNHLSIAHYKMNGAKELSKEINKLDKRVHKLFNKMCDNSMVVVICSSRSSGRKEGEGNEPVHDDDDGDKQGSGGGSRRNNSVCLVRVKVAGLNSNNKRKK